MLKHNLTLFFRNINKYKGTFLINTFGLASGLAATILISIWANFELQFHKFNEKDSAQHVQVMVNRPHSAGINTVPYTPGPLYKAMEEEFPEVSYSVPIVVPRSFYNGLLVKNEVGMKVEPQYVGDGYFNIFGCDFIYGEKESALQDKNSIVISKAVAEGLFGRSDVVGESVELEHRYVPGPYTITGVFELPANASIQYNALIGFERFLDGRSNLRKWNNGGVEVHLVLEKGTDINAFNQKIENFLTTKIEGIDFTLFAQPYAQTYLYGNYENGQAVGGRIRYVRLFLIIAAFIIFIACINFMNLSTANASRRLQEIGIKKVLGAKRNRLTRQYLLESILLSFFALVMAIFLVALLLPEFSKIIGVPLNFQIGWKEFLFLTGLMIATGLLAGSYPALYLSKFEPLRILKGKLSLSASSLWVRNILVVFQFSISIVLIASVLVIYNQIDYLQTKNLGYDKENIISFQIEGDLIKKDTLFLEELKNTVGVKSASRMWGELPGKISGGSGFQWPGQEPEGQDVDFSFIEGGYGMIQLLDVKLKAGRALSQEYSTDKESAIVFNETAIKTMGLEGDPIGQQVYFKGMRTIVGIVEDFHATTLAEKIEPMFFIISNGDHFVVKMEAGTERSTINKIAALYKNYNKTYPFEYSFLDERYQQLYAAEERVSKLSRFFAGLAIIISCLGLLGLATFSAERRRKEISIRKVIGQPAWNVAAMLSGEFTRLVIVAIVIGLPVAYYLSQNWLMNFAYHDSLNIWFFVAAGLIAILIAIITVGIKALQAAYRNPIEGLREE
ncbi:MAG: FtsX-like permease family protein [Bacteroidota bacterium]